MSVDGDSMEWLQRKNLELNLLVWKCTIPPILKAGSHFYQVRKRRTHLPRYPRENECRAHVGTPS